MSQRKNQGILFSAEIRVVGSYTDRLLITIFNLSFWRKNEFEFLQEREVIMYSGSFLESQK